MNSLARSPFVALHVFLLAACGSSDDGSGTEPSDPNVPDPMMSMEENGEGSADDCGGMLCPPSAEEGLQISLSTSLGAGEENTVCRYVHLEKAGNFGEMEHRYTAISHHLILYPTTLTKEAFTDGTMPVELGEVFTCDDVPSRRTAGIIYSTQSAEGTVDYPEGVAYQQPDDSIVMFEYHAINTSGEAMEAEARLNLTWATGEPDFYANTMFFYNYSILIPPRGEGSARMRCTVPNDVFVMASASHMHARGVHQEAWILDEADERATQLYTTEDWDEPSAWTYEPAHELKAGTRIEFWCDYVNDEDRTVIEGPHTTNEMCMAPFTYYAAKDAPVLPYGARLCFSQGSGPVWSGTQSCTETGACLAEVQVPMRAVADEARAAGELLSWPDSWSEDLRIAQEQCLIGTSEAASQAVHDLYGPYFAGDGGCLAQYCGTALDDAGVRMTDEIGNGIPGPCNWTTAADAECRSCLEAYCPTQLAACDAG